MRSIGTLKIFQNVVSKSFSVETVESLVSCLAASNAIVGIITNLAIRVCRLWRSSYVGLGCVGNGCPLWFGLHVKLCRSTVSPVREKVTWSFVKVKPND